MSKTINDLVVETLRGLGYTGTYNDLYRAWLVDQGYTGAVNDAFKAWIAGLGFNSEAEYLRDAGYTGSLVDMRKAALVDGNYFGAGGGGTSLTIVNAGFEDGVTVGWTAELGTPYQKVNNPDPYEGTKFLGAGAASAKSLLTQVVDLTSSISDFTDIDAGNMAATVSWQQSSFAGLDEGTIQLEFQSAGDVVLKEATEGLLAAPEQVWTPRSRTCNIPPNTRKIKVIIRGERFSGSNLDAYFDALQLAIAPATSYDGGLLTNGDFETGDLTGWTSVTGTPEVRSNVIPQGIFGTYWLFASIDTTTSELTQTVDLRDTITDFTAIDAGEVLASVIWEQSSNQGSDKGTVSMQYLTAADGNLGSTNGELLATTEVYWTNRQTIAYIPANTRKITVKVIGSRLIGTGLNAYFDNISLNLL